MAYQIIWEKAAGNLRGALPTVTQGGTYEVITILALYRDGSAVSLTGKPLTATATDEAGNTTEITGTLTGGAGSFTWEFSGGDIGTPGVYTVIVTYNLGDGGLWASDPARFTVLPNPAADSVQNPSLYGVSGAAAAWATVGAAGGALGELAYIDDADSDGTQYVRQDGAWVAIDIDGLAALEAGLIPVAVDDLAATADGTSAIDLAWTYTPVAAISGFKLYRKEGIGGTYALIDSPDPTDTSFADTGLNDDTTYYYRLDAYNTFFTTTGNEANATTDELITTFDFTAMSDGPLPAALAGATFSISSGKAINTPTLGAELLTDPGLEANYTTGKCDTLTMNGTPTVAQSADVHGGSKAQQMESTAANQWLRYPQVTPTAGQWYRGQLWHKLTVGAASADFYSYFSQAAAFPSGGGGYGRIYSGTGYQQLQTSFLANSTGVISLYAFTAFANRTGIADDGSLKAITYADLFAMIPSAVSRLATAKIKPDTIADNSITGVIVWANASASPSTYVMACIRRRLNVTNIEIGLIKVVAGAPTQLITMTSATEVANAELEIRPVDDDTVGLYYNNAQVGGNIDVADVPGSYAGIFVSGGNNLKSFFLV